MYFFDAFREALGAGLEDLTSSPMYAVLIAEGVYTPSQSTDEFLSDIPSGARFGTPQEFESPTLVDGVFDFPAGSITFPAVSGAVVHGILKYMYTGDEDTSRLVAYNDAKFTITCAASGASGDTVLRVDPLQEALANSTLLPFSGGSASARLSAAAASGQRLLSVEALSGTVLVDTSCQALAAVASGLPYTLNGNAVRVSWTDEVFTL